MTTTDTGIDTLYAAWAADVAAGRDSIMMAPTLDLVAELNQRARADRIAAAGGNGDDQGRALVMGNGDTDSAGDRIVTKKNDRYLRLGGGTDFVTRPASPGGRRWLRRTGSPPFRPMSGVRCRGVLVLHFSRRRCGPRRLHGPFAPTPFHAVSCTG